MKIWGREPTLWVAAVSAILSLLVTFNVGLDANQAALWVAGINAVLGAVAAWATRPIAPQAFTYVVSSLAALTGAYGLDFTVEQTGAASAVVTVVLALLARGQVSPASEAPKTGVLGAARHRY